MEYRFYFPIRNYPVFGDGGDAPDMAEGLADRGWELSPDGEKARQYPDEEWMPLADAYQAYREWLESND